MMLIVCFYFLVLAQAKMYHKDLSHRGSCLPAGYPHLLEEVVAEDVCFDDVESKCSALDQFHS